MEPAIDLFEHVPLKRGTGRETVTLSTSLRSRAREAKLPAWLADLVAVMERSEQALSVAITQSVRAKARNAKTQRGICSDGWSALRMAVQAHLLLPDHDVPADLQAATELDRSLFGDGLAFLSATTHEDAYGGSETLLEVLDKPAMQAHVATLGVEAFVRGVRRGHDAFGRAARFTVAPEEEGDVDGTLEAHRKEIKRYLGQVMGWRDRGEDVEGVAPALLQPWTVWNPAGPESASDDEEAAPASGPDAEEPALDEVDLDEALGPDLRPAEPSAVTERS